MLWITPIMDLPGKDIYSRMVPFVANRMMSCGRDVRKIENEILMRIPLFTIYCARQRCPATDRAQGKKLILRKKEVERKISAIEQAWEGELFDTPMHREVIRKISLRECRWSRLTCPVRSGR